jgi:hypothetical protein
MARKMEKVRHEVKKEPKLTLKEKRLKKRMKKAER